MATDLVGHNTPASTEAPARSAFDKLSRSLRDPIPVADATARSAMLASLAAASPAVTPSSSTPIFFYQQDLPKAYRTIWTTDGSNFVSTSGHYVWADATARGAATGMSSGDLGVQVDTKVIYRYDGTAWNPKNAFVAFRIATPVPITSGVDATLDLDASPSVAVGTWSESAGVVTMPADGAVIVTSQAVFESGGTPTLYQLSVTKNGTTDSVLRVTQAPAIGRAPLTSGYLRVTKGDTLRVRAFHNAGATKTVGELNSSTPVLTIHYID